MGVCLHFCALLKKGGSQKLAMSLKLNLSCFLFFSFFFFFFLVCFYKNRGRLLRAHKALTHSGKKLPFLLSFFFFL